MAALYAVIGFVEGGGLRRNHAQSAKLDSDDVARRKRECALFGLTPPPHSPAAANSGDVEKTMTVHVNGDSNPPILTVTANSEARFTKYLIRQSYDYLTIMPKLRSVYDGHLIYQTSYEERKTFLRYDLLAKS